ncbi:MAG: hypothetical protein P1U57_06105 [Oleibacter sp.]|nr:hypothetical protein [Thalassolituus sp.]
MDIGFFSSTGEAITPPPSAVPFHQQLLEQDCIACHLDHVGVRRLTSIDGFDHALLNPALANQCEGCHQAPTDSFHQNISSNCGQCHSQEKWKPITFEHSEYFELDHDHNTQCDVCHVNNDFQNYTCYGCHEHTPKNIFEEHREEGIHNFENCVECHRSADEDDIEHHRIN